ncbi:MAG TPA: hypothetical protein VMZ66_05970 [Aeromicrobium sp.]|nr:hypothetical protein [Aeromicrobium sp.]
MGRAPVVVTSGAALAQWLGHTLQVHLSVYLFAKEADIDATASMIGQRLRTA